MDVALAINSVSLLNSSLNSPTSGLMGMPTIPSKRTQGEWSAATTVSVLKQPAGRCKLVASNLRGPGKGSHLAKHNSGAQLPKVEGKLLSQELPPCQASVTRLCIFLLAHGSLSLTLFSCPSLYPGLALACHHLCNPRWKHNGYWPCLFSPRPRSTHSAWSQSHNPSAPHSAGFTPACWFHTCLLSSHTSGSPARNSAGPSKCPGPGCNYHILS